jgi:hypothetical protein
MTNVALRAWRALPSAVRREAAILARQGVAHPDPSVARAALAAARAVRPWNEAVLWVCFAGLGLSLVTLLSVRHGPDYYGLLGVLVLIAAWAGLASVLIGLWGIGFAASACLEAVGARDVVARTPPAAPAPLTVAARRHPRRYWIAWPGMAVIYAAGIEVMHAWVSGPGWEDLPMLACMPVVMSGFLLIGLRSQTPPWARRRPPAGQPALVLDAAGIALPHLNVALPWELLPVVELRALPRTGLCLYVADVAVPMRWLTEPPERILAAARDYRSAARAAAPTGS